MNRPTNRFGDMSRGGGSGRAASEFSENLLEAENDRKVDALAGKVARLKDLTIDIGDHIRDDNRLLGEMGNDFEGMGGLLGGSMRRLSALTSGGGNKVMCYMVMFIVSVFMIIWYLIR